MRSARARKLTLGDVDFEKLFRDEFLLNVEQAAVLIQVSASTLNHWRSDGFGPPFVKLCGTARGAVRYRVGDIRKWLDSRVVSSAAEAMMLDDAMSRVSMNVLDWVRPHPFIVRSSFIVDSAVADRETLVHLMHDPYAKVRWLKPAEALSKPWLRPDRRQHLVESYLNSSDGVGKKVGLDAAYAHALAQVPEHLYGSHPDLTLDALNIQAGGEYRIEFGQTRSA